MPPRRSAELDEAHELGIDPTQLLRGLMESLHAATRAKAGASGRCAAIAPRSAKAPTAMARQLGWGAIHRLWQMLLKGLQDVDAAPDPREAAEMALLRLIHAADMPDPASLMARLSGERCRRSGPPRRRRMPSAARRPRRVASRFPRPGQASGEEPASTISRQQLHDQVGLVRYAPPELVLKPHAAARRRLAARRLRRR